MSFVGRVCRGREPGAVVGPDVLVRPSRHEQPGQDLVRPEPPPDPDRQALAAELVDHDERPRTRSLAAAVEAASSNPSARGDHGVVRDHRDVHEPVLDLAGAARVVRCREAPDQASVVARLLAAAPHPALPTAPRRSGRTSNVRLLPRREPQPDERSG